MVLTESVRAHAQAAPERIAVSAGSRHLSYGQLWQQAVAFADSLKRVGVKSGDRVAYVLANCSEAVVACYGTWIAGGIAVPLNAQARPPELAPWLRHCEPVALVHEPGFTEISKESMPANLSRIVVGGPPGHSPAFRWDDMVASNAAPSSPLRLSLADDRPAMIIYTSGTTGRPKGVTLSHRNLASNTGSIIDYLGLTASDSAVSVLPFYYAYGSSVLNTHLAAGARIVLEQGMTFPHAIVESIVRERVTGFPGVPSTFALLLSRVDLGRYDLSSLRYLTQAGGPMPVANIKRLCAAIPNARLFVMYGQTEATARLTWLPPELLDSKQGSVGRAIPGTEVEVRSEGGVPAGIDQVGEIWARGANVMLGYWRDDAQTSTVLTDGWLRTGDMGRVDADGFLYIEGRRTDMIKVGAHRIYPRDVEEAIAELPDVAEVVVIGIADELLGEVIKAFVVPRTAGAVNALAVQAHCRARLAPYKIPKHVQFVMSLPKTASGKIRRRALLESAPNQEES